MMALAIAKSEFFLMLNQSYGKEIDIFFLADFLKIFDKMVLNASKPVESS